MKNRKTHLSILGNRLLINRKLIYSEIPGCPEKYHGLLMNARFIQGVFDDAADRQRFNRFGQIFDPNKNTEDLIHALPQWYEHGLRAITVGFQGGGPCFTIDSMTIDNNAFSKDGRSMKPEYLDRMNRIIEAADEIGMIVIVSLFYGPQSRFLENDLAVINAVKTASNWLRDQKYTNVILEIANEQNLDAYRIHPILFDEKGISELMRISKRESGGIPVGCSTTDKYFSYVIGQESDAILIHGNNMTRQGFYNYIQKAKSIKPSRPIICNEDSQALSHMQVAMDSGVSWGYYNNLTKQEPPVRWGITRGEDEFFAERLAVTLGITKNRFSLEEEFYLQGLEKNNEYEGERWIRLASMHPERIDKVSFFRNEAIYETSYDDPFTVNFVYNWIQLPTTNIKKGEEWMAVVQLSDGTTVVKKATAE